MKFNFNETFLKSLTEILDTREKALKKHIQGNYAHYDDVLCKEDIEERLNEVENIIENSEIEHKVNIIDQEDLESRIEDLENCDELVKRLSEVDSGFLTSASIDERILEEIDTRCLNDDDLEARLLPLEHIIENQESDIHALKILRDDQEKRILTLESENQEMKDRLLTLENFILKTFKGF